MINQLKSMYFVTAYQDKNFDDVNQTRHTKLLAWLGIHNVPYKAATLLINGGKVVGVTLPETIYKDLRERSREFESNLLNTIEI